MNLEAKQRLAGLVRSVRGDMDQRDFAKKIGVSQATIQSWESARVDQPKVESLSKFASVAGYTIEELLEYLNGKSGQPHEINQILRKIRELPLSDVAMIARAATDRLATVMEKH